MEFGVAVPVRFGAIGGATFVEALMDELAEPPSFPAVNWKSYPVSASRPVIVALVALVPGAGVQVCHAVVPDTRYSNV